MSKMRALGKVRQAVLGLVLAAMAGGAHSTEYEYRDLLGNTLAPRKCSSQADAGARAQEKYNIDKFVKLFCETQGYGWHVADVKENGKLVCNECEGKSDKFQCHVEDIRVTCKHIKPGSVGMLPGKG